MQKSIFVIVWLLVMMSFFTTQTSASDEIYTKKDACTLSNWFIEKWLEVTWEDLHVYSFFKKDNFLIYTVIEWLEYTKWIYLYEYNCSLGTKRALSKESLGSGIYIWAEIINVIGNNIYIYKYIGDSIWYSFGDNIIFNVKSKKFNYLNWKNYLNKKILPLYNWSINCWKYEPYSWTQWVLNCPDQENFEINTKYIVDISSKKIIKKKN